MTEFVRPFTCSRLKVGIHILQGCWYEIKDANNTLVCTIPVARNRSESAVDAQTRLDNHAKAVVNLFNRGAT